MTTLPEFVLARNAEREAVALAATVAPWSDARGVVESPGVPVAMQPGWDQSVPVARFVLDRDATHIALNDPAHVMAWCETVRRIVELHGRGHECSVYEDGGVDNCHWCLDGDECSTLRLLASVYADHPDYDPEWTV